MLEEIFQQCKDFEFYKTDSKIEILMVLGYNIELDSTIKGLLINKY